MNDIFISYRREGGSTTARLICKMLEDAGFRCFFDSESLSFGSFADSIKDNLRNSRNFLLIMSPGALERCHSPDDWVRQEIALALELYKADQIKRIIPLFTNGVTGFPADLPADIRAISEQNAIELNHKDFDTNFTRLRERIHHEKRDKLVNQFLELHSEDDEEEDDLDHLLSTFSECLTRKQQFYALKSSIKMHWDGLPDKLLEGYSEEFLRVLCEKFDLPNEGGKNALLDRIKNWANNKPFEQPYKVISKDILSSYINHQDSSVLGKLCDKLNLMIDKRRRQAMQASLCNRLDIDIDFSDKDLSFDILRAIAEAALGVDAVSGCKKQELIEILADAYKKGREL